MAKLKKFFGSKTGKVVKALLLCASGAAAQELNVPFLSDAMRAALLFLGA